MDLRRLSIRDVLVLTSKCHSDDRGYFVESYSRAAMATLGPEPVFVQNNLSLSRQVGPWRGLQYQRPPQAQANLVQVLQGHILDVAIDARRSSPTSGRHLSAQLSKAVGEQDFIPVGLPHGFVTLQPDALVAYEVNAPDCDGTIRWDDSDFGIDWRIGAGAALLSAKDAAPRRFSDFDSPFVYVEPEGGHA